VARFVVSTRPDVIVAVTDAVVRAFKAATSTIPMVVICSDPVAQGFAATLARPGGNITGVSAYAGLETIGKYLELLKEIDPRIQRVGLLAPQDSWELKYGQALTGAATQLHIELLGPPLASPVDEHEYRRVVALMAAKGAQALLAETTGVNFVHAKQIAELASVHRLASLSPYAEHVRFGGLVAYATDFEDQYRHMARHVDRVLRGEKPADIPFYRPTTARLMLNLKTASALGLAIPPTLLARADEVIE
jgi:putative ABC transport system substrate-binding protein